MIYMTKRQEKMIAATTATALVASSLAAIPFIETASATPIQFEVTEGANTKYFVTVKDKTAEDDVKTTFKAYKLFEADVMHDDENDKDVVSNVRFASGKEDKIIEAINSALGINGLSDEQISVLFAGQPTVKNYIKAIDSAEKAQLAAQLIQEKIENGTNLSLDPQSFGYKLSDEIRYRLGDDYIEMESGTSTDFEEKDAGYYLIIGNDLVDDTYNAATGPIFLTVGGRAREVDVKTALPTLTKQVQEDDFTYPAAEGAWGNNARQTKGEKLKFQLDGTLPSDYARYAENDNSSIYYKYEITDAPAGLDIDLSSIKVTMTNAKVNTGTLEDPQYVTRDVVLYENEAFTDEDITDGKYGPTISKDENGTLKVYFDDLRMFSLGNSSFSLTSESHIIVEYMATITGDSTETKDNTAYLVYSNDPNNQTSTGQTPSTTTTVDNFSFSLKKTDDSETPVAKSGATFAIKTAANKYIKFDADGKVTGEVTDKMTTIQTPADGVLRIDGLDSGTYTVEEVDAPSGYNKLFSTFDVTIADDGTVTVSGNEDNTLNYNKVIPTTITVDDKPHTTIQVVNTQGIELPITGQQGFMLITIAGGIILVAALGGSLARRRKNAEE